MADNDGNDAWVEVKKKEKVAPTSMNSKNGKNGKNGNDKSNSSSSSSSSKGKNKNNSSRKSPNNKKAINSNSSSNTSNTNGNSNHNSNSNNNNNGSNNVIVEINNDDSNNNNNSGSSIETKNDITVLETVFDSMHVIHTNDNDTDDNDIQNDQPKEEEDKKNDYIPTLKEFCITTRDVLKQYMNNHSSSGGSSNGNSRCVGLINTGNTCYRNCILQVLLSLPPFYTILNQLIDLFIVSNLPNELKAWKQLLEFTLEYKNKIYKNGKLISALSREIPVLDPELHLKELFETFKRKVHPNGIPTVTVTTNNGKNKKNGSTKIISSQEDAHEFLTFLLDTLDEEMNGVSDEDEKEPVDIDNVPEESGWETVNKPGVKEVVDDSSREDAVRKSASTLISRLFHGTLRSEVVYSNKKISSRFQIITQIQIELLELIGKEQKKPVTNKASSSSSINISDALKLYFAEEDLDNGARKRVKLENAPQILILHLKRFTFDYSKNIPIKINHDVHYDINLTIPMECLSPDLMANCIKNNQNKKVSQHNDSSDSDSDSDNGKNDIQNFNGIRYKLIGLILHHGLHATGGHYTSITKENDGTWKSMDDSTGSYISHGEALDGKKQVYLLFYEKI